MPPVGPRISTLSIDLPMDVEHQFSQVAALLREHRDVVEERVTEPVVPPWCARRGWSDFLLSLPEEALCCCEADGFLAVLAERSDAPPSLLRLMQRVRDAVRVPSLHRELPLERSDAKRVKARKQAQLSALLGAASSFARDAARIVDVGAGQGHLTRAASRAWDKDALGLDREASLVSVAKDLARDQRVDFRRWDAFQEEVALEASDLVLGLHACGEVGDVLVKRSAEAGARVLLVSCCPQKVRAEHREPLSRAGCKEQLRLPRLVLGLANLSQLEQGVESSLVDTMRSRQTRHAMRLLLQRRDLPVRAGEEMRGVNRRRAYRGLPALAEAVLAFRELPPATITELADCERQALIEYGMMRRLSLPRAMFARLVELAVVLDRAMFLRERGYLVEVSTVFDATVSPRNLGIFATPRPVGKAC